MKKIITFISVFIVSTTINAGFFIELGVTDHNTDVDSLSFLNPVGTAFTTNSTDGDFINLANLNDTYEKDGRSIKIGMDVADNIDVYIVHKSFGAATASGTATFAGNDFTQELRLDMNLTAIGVSVNVDMGGNHTLSPVLEIGKADTDVSGRQIDPSGGFNSFPNADGDDTTFGYGLAYKYSLSEDLSMVASYMINDLGDTSTGVTGAGIAGMNAGEQLQSEVEITQLTLGFQLRL